MWLQKRICPFYALKTQIQHTAGAPQRVNNELFLKSEIAPPKNKVFRGINEVNSGNNEIIIKNV